MKPKHVPIPHRPNPGSVHIPAPVTPGAEVLLSFKHLNLTDKFTPKGREAEYIITALGRMREMCKLKPQELKQSGKVWRCHTIKWDETSEPKGYEAMPKSFQDSEPMQISLGKADGRLQGYFVGSTFYVVWFDAHHQLYP